MIFDYSSVSWQETRDWVLSFWDGRCERCGASDEDYYPHVHHTHGTDVEKFEVLCPTCHGDHHNNDELRQTGWKKHEPELLNPKPGYTHDYTDKTYLQKGNHSLNEY